MNAHQIKFRLLALGLGTAVAAGSHAAFVPIDTFEQYDTGFLDGQTTDWANPLGNIFDNQISVDPADAGNQVLEVAPGSSTNQRIALTMPTAQHIAIGDTGTLFFRIRLDGQIDGETRDVRIGLNDQNPTTVTTTGAHETYIQVNNAVDLVAFDGPTGVNGNGTQTLGTPTPDEWYNVWMVADAAALTYDIYLEGPGFTGVEQVANGFGFRNANNVNDPPQALEDALGTINLRPASGGPNGTSSVWFDDFYIDNSAANLTNPIPEPTSLALLGLGGTLLLLRCRA